MWQWINQSTCHRPLRKIDTNCLTLISAVMAAGIEFQQQQQQVRPRWEYPSRGPSSSHPHCTPASWKTGRPLVQRSLFFCKLHSLWAFSSFANWMRAQALGWMEGTYFLCRGEAQFLQYRGASLIQQCCRESAHVVREPLPLPGVDGKEKWFTIALTLHWNNTKQMLKMGKENCPQSYSVTLC